MRKQPARTQFDKDIHIDALWQDFQEYMRSYEEALPPSVPELLPEEVAMFASMEEPLERFGGYLCEGYFCELNELHCAYAQLNACWHTFPEHLQCSEKEQLSVSQPLVALSVAALLAEQKANLEAEFQNWRTTRTGLQDLFLRAEKNQWRM